MKRYYILTHNKEDSIYWKLHRGTDYKVVAYLFAAIYRLFYDSVKIRGDGKDIIWTKSM